MTLYFILYLFVSIAYIFLGINVFLKYKKYLFWKYFLLSVVLICLWLLLYMLFFISPNENFALNVSRIMYWLSIFFTYSMISFFINYPFKLKSDFFYNFVNKILIILFFSLSFFAVFSDFVISWMNFNLSRWAYIEQYWVLYNLFLFIYLLFTPVILFIYFAKLKLSSFINRIRLKIIFYWFLATYVISVFTILILPLFGIIYFYSSFWIVYLNKLIIFFLFPFLFSVLYVSHRYNFLNIKFLFWKIIVFIFSLFLSFIIIYLFKSLILLFSDRFLSFWWFSSNLNYTDFILWISVFYFLYKFLLKIFLWKTKYHNFEQTLTSIKRRMFFINDFSKFKDFLSLEFKSKMKIKDVTITLVNNRNSKKLSELINFFKKDLARTFFINDLAFIEENKNKFNAKLITKQVSEKTFIIFPLFDRSGELIWLFKLWNKPFKDYFFEDEIDSLKIFSNFLVWHLNYIKIYDRLKDTNLYLERKVDKKTMKYNYLINKQNEFINFVSHELSNPMAILVFQIDTILESFKSWDLKKKELERELEDMNLNLIKTSNLINTIFSNQKYEIGKVTLFREPVNIKELISFEVETLGKKYENIDFSFKVLNEVWFVSIDKIQFLQVISNLLNNSIKYVDKDNPKIQLTLHKSMQSFILTVEDNWPWIDNESISNIFDKYRKLDNSSEGFWFWLYLCEKIVFLHGWTIKAYNSKELSWAMFKIKIPIKN